METIVIYHGGCRDGFCAAWVYNKYINESFDSALNEDDRARIEYHPGFYGQEPPTTKDKHVIIVDFCYDLEIMKAIAEDCISLVWLDHHKTAIPVNMWLNSIEIIDKRIDWVFNQEKSGAGLVWDFFFPDKDRPWIVDYVEDRDLWTKDLPNTDLINAFIACLEFDFKVWNKYSEYNLDMVVKLGEIAQMKTEQYVREVCKNVYFVDVVPDDILDTPFRPIYEHIPCVNICQVDCSEVLHELCVKHPDAPFSLYWFKRQDGLYQYGMRSIGDFDVSEVAKLFGGGGHKNAAGFQLDYLLEELR